MTFASKLFWLGLLALGACLLSHRCFGASTYCVGPWATGNGQGGDWNNLKSWASTPSRGDTWYLVNGSYAAKTLSTTNSGTALITIKKATASNYTDVSAMGWSSAYASQATIAGLTISSSYWLIDGVTGDGASVMPTDTTISNYGFYVNPTSHPILLTGSLTDITIKHVRFYTTIVGGTGIYQTDVINGSKNNVTISYCLFDGFNEMIRNGADTWNYTVLEYSVILNSQGSSSAHGNAINAMYRPLANMTIRYNVFKDMVGDGISGMISGNNSSIGPVFCYGNVFDNIPHCTYIIGANSGYSINNSTFYNNTVIHCDNDSYDFAICGRTSGSGNVGGNNLLYDVISVLYNSAWSGDYDAFYSCSRSSGTHKYTATGDPFVNRAGMDYRLKTNTPAGTSLASPYDVDALGIARTTWTRGATEYQSGTVNTNPPAIQTQPLGLTNSTLGTFALSVTISNTTSSSNLVYQWQRSATNISGATASGYTVPSQTANSDSYRVVVTNYYGSITSAAASVLITNVAVVAGFTGGPTNGLAPLTVRFSNSSSGAASYSWAFGDDKSSTVTSPTNTYTNAGTYSVVLTAVGAGGTNALTRTSYVVATNPVPRLRVYPNSRAYGALHVGTSSNLTFTVQNIGNGTLSGTSSVAAPFSIYGSSSYGLTANQSQTITVQYAPIAGETNVETVNFTGGDAVNGWSETNASVTGSGFYVPEMQTFPNSRDFGTVNVGNSAVLSFYVANIGDGVLEGSASVAAPFTVDSGSPYSVSNNTAMVLIRYTPTENATDNGTVTFTGGAGTNVSVTGIGRASPPPPPPPPNIEIAVSPDALDFGRVLPGGTTNLSVMVSNSGTGLAEGTATVSAPFYVVSGSPYSIATNDTQEVVIQYAPTVSGVAYGVVTFTGGDGSACDVVGTAVEPVVITVQPQSANATVGQDVTFTVTATGTSPLSYQWNVNLAPIDGATNNYYTTRNVQEAAEAAVFTVFITNDYSWAMSDQAILVVTGGVAVVEVDGPRPLVPRPRVFINGQLVTLMVNESQFLPGVLASSLQSLIAGVTNNALAEAGRQALNPATKQANADTNNVAWSNTFLFKGCAAVGSMTQGEFGTGDTNADGLYQGRGSLIAPRFLFSQGHSPMPFRPSVETARVRFIGTNGTVYLRRIIAREYFWDGSNTFPPDQPIGTEGGFAVALLDEDLPGDVEPVKFWPTNLWRYTSTDATTFQSPMVGTCQHNRYVVPTLPDTLLNTSWLPQRMRVCDYGATGGDSGSPNYTVLNNELVFNFTFNPFRHELLRSTMMFLWTNNGLPGVQCQTPTEVDLSPYSRLR